MTRNGCHRVVLLVVGAALTASGASARPSVGPVAAPSAAGQESPPAAPQQEPDEFRLAERNRRGQEGSEVSAGDTRLIFDSIFDFSESVNDLFIWGWIPTISGDIADNAFLGGQRIEITPEARIGGDLFLFCQTGTILGRIGGDLYGFVAELTIGEGAVIEGAMLGSMATLTIDGDVAGPLRVAGGVVEINGTVRGDIRLEAGELSIGPDAVIMGELQYESPREATIDPAADLQGDVVYFAPRDESDGEDEENAVARPRFLSFWGLLWDLWWLLSSFLVGAIALAIGGEAARRPAQRLVREPALGLGFGFVIAVVFPAAAILALVLVVTIPLGLISLAVYCAAGYLGRLVAAQAIGDRLLASIRGGKSTSAYASLALGLVVFYLLTQIPYVGFLIWLAAVVAGLGGIFLAFRRVGPEDAEPVGAVTSSP